MRTARIHQAEPKHSHAKQTHKAMRIPLASTNPHTTTTHDQTLLQTFCVPGYLTLHPNTFQAFRILKTSSEHQTSCWDT